MVAESNRVLRERGGMALSRWWVVQRTRVDRLYLLGLPPMGLRFCEVVCSNYNRRGREHKRASRGGAADVHGSFRLWNHPGA